MTTMEYSRALKFGTIGFLALACMGAGFILSAPADAAAPQPQATLTAFRTESDLADYLKRLKREIRRRQNAQSAPMDAAPAPAPPPMAGVAGEVSVTASRAPSAPGATSITNVQEQGVDEGDIVKNYGDILVILRRGRLFTVSLAGGGMRPVDSINAYPPGVNARSDWYDEMLISDDRVIVIGYSYGRGGTEINRFRISRGGKLRFEDAYHLRSNDYYSARNYASRLIGNKLILYAPLYLQLWSDDPLANFPALRRWTGKRDARFERIASASHVYMSPFIPDEQINALHTVTTCDLTTRVLDCHATSVMGAPGRVFYVSPRAVYVWVTPWGRGDERGRKPSSVLYRMPLDGGPPSAVGVRGGPEDQFSFREDANDGVVNVLVRSQAGGDAMWLSEFSRGSVALLRLPISAFGDGNGEAARRHYRTLPKPEGNAPFHNRFAGRFVLYGTGNGWGRPQGGESTLYAVPLRGGEVEELELPHGVDRIEVMGRDALVVGSDRRDVTFTEIDLRARPRVGDRYVLEGAAQAETRSHGFFYKSESNDGDGGVLGLPVARPARAAYKHLFETSAAITFVRRANRSFRPLGELEADDRGAVNDGCVASCVDWYGNARPIFMGERTFALMGYELVEGRTGPRAVREVDRVNFAPQVGRPVRGEPEPDDGEDE